MARILLSRGAVLGGQVTAAWPDGKYSPDVAWPTWKMTVWSRLQQVETDLERAVSARGWHLAKDSSEPGGTRFLIYEADGTLATCPLAAEACDIIAVTSEFVGAAYGCLELHRGVRGVWERIIRERGLMAAYTNLHAAEKNRVLLLSADQLLVILPLIRDRARAYLLPDDAYRAALGTVPDLTVPAYHAVQTRAASCASSARSAGTARSRAGSVPVAVRHGTTELAPAGPEHTLDQERQPTPQPHPGALTHPPAGTHVLTEMLGADQRIAAEVFGATCTAEDFHQEQVRRFRKVLLSTAAGLFLLAVLLGILGLFYPDLIPLCLHGQAAAAPTTICPAGRDQAGAADVPLILGAGAVGATLAVAKTLSQLKPSGVRYSLSVAQGFVKIALGAITAVLGILILETQSIPSGLRTQGGILISAVVFGYSQQLFTGLIDQRATKLMNRASSATPPSQPD